MCVVEEGYSEIQWGCLQFAFSSFFCKGTSIQAEAKASLLGMKLCVQRGFMQVIVESDSMVVVRILKDY